MPFAIIYTHRANRTEETEKRDLELFRKWKPPAGIEFRTHYAFADGSGGILIAEASTALSLLEAHVPWRTFSEFKTVPVVEMADAAQILEKVYMWRDSVQ